MWSTLPLTIFGQAAAHFAHLSASSTSPGILGTSAEGFFDMALEVIGTVEADLHQRILPGPLFSQCLSPYICDLVGGWPDVRNPTGPCITLSVMEQVLPGAAKKAATRRLEALERVRGMCATHSLLPAFAD